MIFNILGLKLINFIIDLLPDFAVDNIPILNTANNVINIFAWVNYFIPVNVIMILLGITAGYYSFKLFYSIIKSTKDILF